MKHLVFFALFYVLPVLGLEAGYPHSGANSQNRGSPVAAGVQQARRIQQNIGCLNPCNPFSHRSPCHFGCQCLQQQTRPNEWFCVNPKYPTHEKFGAPPGHLPMYRMW
uniref:Putative secreted protein n=1 Tax=Amblyomma americanum TaxID=6943 RepID=A0A0C9SER6_AMBAM